MKEGKPPIIYGDGEQTRDFTFVKDTAMATIKAGTSEKVNGEVINVAGGKRITINKLASIIAEIMGKDIGVKHIEERIGDVKHSLADINKAKNILDFMPIYEIGQGLLETVNRFID